MKSLKTILSLVAFAVAEAPLAQVPLSSAQPLTLEGIPLLGFGTWNLKGENATAAVSWAIQTGYRHIDCADAYRNEEYVGLGIAEGLAKTGLNREDIWVTSKLWNDHHEPAVVEAAINTTIDRLGVGYLDLFHMHWPVAATPTGTKIDYLDTWAAMTLLAKNRRTRYIGVSNFSPAQLNDLIQHTSHPPAVHQMELHPYLQQKDWVAWHEEHGIHVTAYSPLAGTNPTYSPGGLPPLLKSPVLDKIAEKRGCTIAQVALQWGMSRGTSVIPKSAHKEYITSNFHAPECILKAKDLKKLDKLGEYQHRFNNPSKSWGVDLYEGLEGV